MSKGANKTAPMRSLVSMYILPIHRNRALKYSDMFFVCKIKKNFYVTFSKYCTALFPSARHIIQSTCKTIKHIKYRTSDRGRTFSTIGYTCKLIRTAIRRVARQRPGSLDLNYIGFI